MDIETYFQNLKNPKHLEDLEKLRAYLDEQLPYAEVNMQYGMPSYVINGQTIVTMASQRNYMSLYMDVDLVEQYRAELGDCGKSCVRFKKFENLPLDLIGSIIAETVKKV